MVTVLAFNKICKTRHILHDLLQILGWTGFIILCLLASRTMNKSRFRSRACHWAQRYEDEGAAACVLHLAGSLAVDAENGLGR